MKKIIWFLLLCVLLVSCNDTMTFYTVTFDSDGGSKVPQQEVLEGKTAVEPKSPTRNGDIFLSWDLEEGGGYNFSTPVTGNIKLKAKYNSAEDIKTLKIEAQKVYDIADIFISKTAFINLDDENLSDVSSAFTDKTNDIGDLVIEALNLDTQKATTYILLDKREGIIFNSHTNITSGDKYISSDYNITINTASLKKSKPTKDDENNTYAIELTNLKLSVTYTKKNDNSGTITNQSSNNSTTQTVTFEDVNIQWTKTTEDKETYIKGTIKMTVDFGDNNDLNNDLNNKYDYNLTFTANGQGLLTATYGTQYLIF